MHLIRTGGEEAARVLRRYLLIARSGSVHLDVTRSSTDAELVAAADRYPVYRIDPDMPSRT